MRAKSSFPFRRGIITFVQKGATAEPASHSKPDFVFVKRNTLFVFLVILLMSRIPSIHLMLQ